MKSASGAGTCDSNAISAFETATRMLVGLASRSLAGEPVTLPQFRLLAALAEQGPLPSSRAAAALGLNASSVTRLGDRLALGGLISRTREPDKRSVVTLALTPAGDQLVQRVRASRRDTLARLLAQLDPREVDTAAKTLQHLAALAADDEELGDHLTPYSHG
ncbi:MarR family transcriptional regulator [Saccharopolyspora sp. WRP15-2]|uniref:MarR family transcriptional regulator n=1 Tax=Saccharopolyspora oryzae TaxID=2997343 RepID=A0ABT4UV33_9PSEU|nr:MarR family transcriptional regulator [Saccharopolyspora oryzae]MDA3625585.1 MarR family transcriptional regulator [Saccharopolyspora oryzae]